MALTMCVSSLNTKSGKLASAESNLIGQPGTLVSKSEARRRAAGAIGMEAARRRGPRLLQPRRHPGHVLLHSGDILVSPAHVQVRLGYLRSHRAHLVR